MTLIHKILIGLVVVLLVAGISFYEGRKTAPVQVQNVDHVIDHNNIVTVTKIVKEKDGTTQETTTTTDTSTKASIDNKTTVNPTVQKDKRLDLGIQYNFTELRQDYNVSFSKRLIGDLWLGARIDTNKTIGAFVGFEF